MENQKPIRITKDQIQKTEAFKKLPELSRKVVLNKTVVKHIQHAVSVCLFIGFEKWEDQTSFSSTNESIVKELFNLRKNVKTA